MQSNLMITLFPPPPPLFPALSPKGIISLSNLLSFTDTHSCSFKQVNVPLCASFRKSALANYTSFRCQARKKPIKKIFMFKAGILKKMLLLKIIPQTTLNRF